MIAYCGSYCLAWIAHNPPPRSSATRSMPASVPHRDPATRPTTTPAQAVDVLRRVLQEPLARPLKPRTAHPLLRLEAGQKGREIGHRKTIRPDTNAPSGRLGHLQLAFDLEPIKGNDPPPRVAPGWPAASRGPRIGRVALRISPVCARSCRRGSSGPGVARNQRSGLVVAWPIFALSFLPKCLQVQVLMKYPDGVNLGWANLNFGV